MTEAEKLTGVPASSQKLIINGKALTSLDYNKPIGDCRIQDGTKVMVLGKKYDIEADKQIDVVTNDPIMKQAQYCGWAPAGRAGSPVEAMCCKA